MRNQLVEAGIRACQSAPDIVGNALPTFALSRGIDLEAGLLWSGEAFQMV